MISISKGSLPSRQAAANDSRRFLFMKASSFRRQQKLSGGRRISAGPRCEQESARAGSASHGSGRSSLRSPRFFDSAYFFWIFQGFRKQKRRLRRLWARLLYHISKFALRITLVFTKKYDIYAAKRILHRRLVFAKRTYYTTLPALLHRLHQKHRRRPRLKNRAPVPERS